MECDISISPQFGLSIRAKYGIVANPILFEAAAPAQPTKFLHLQEYKFKGQNSTNHSGSYHLRALSLP